MRLLIESGTMTVTQRVKAQQDGRLGEAISVLNPDTKKALEATVRSANEVEVLL